MHDNFVEYVWGRQRVKVEPGFNGSFARIRISHAILDQEAIDVSLWLQLFAPVTLS